MKNPIYSLAIPVGLLGVWYVLRFGIFAFFFLYKLFGVYLLFFFISYYLKEKNYPKRVLVEWIMVVLFAVYTIIFELYVLF